VTFPKIELHVHLEGTVRAGTLLRIARRNDVSLPADSVEGLARLYEFRDFSHFIEVWELTTCALRTADDFRQVVVDYAAEAASHGAVYLEGIFTPAEPVRLGVRWEEVFDGYCDGAQEACELHGVQVRLTPEIARSYPLEAALETVRYALAYRDRGVVAIGLGGSETLYPAEPYAPAFDVARDGGLGSVPHAGELGSTEAVRTALDLLSADRIRHGIAAVRDPGLVREIAARGVVLDVCPISNVRTRAVSSLAEHPLPDLVAAGISCSVSTDDPAMFSTDLAAEYAAAAQLGVDGQTCYSAGLRGALCDEPTHDMLREIGDAFDWLARLARWRGSRRERGDARSASPRCSSAGYDGRSGPRCRIGLCSCPSASPWGGAARPLLRSGQSAHARRTGPTSRQPHQCARARRSTERCPLAEPGGNDRLRARLRRSRAFP
jgi:aminodeoxyfutalosine deaminase